MFRAPFAIFLSLFLLVGPAVAQEDEGNDDGRTLRWRELLVQAQIDADGRLHVTERQAMVFDGAWNGGERALRLRLGQEIDFHSLHRIEADGRRIEMVPGSTDRVDGYEQSGSGVRWRSRLPEDPPFSSDEIVYEIRYTLWPVLVSDGNGGYLLRHDFAFPDRAGPIESFRVEITLDPAWESALGPRIVEEATNLPPGRGYNVTLPLRYVGSDEPAAVGDTGVPSAARWMIAAGALLFPLLLILGLRARGREIEQVAPATAPSEIDEDWLRRHILHLPAEVVGTAWDRSVGEPEVAALLARLVAEGKLASRVEKDGKDPVLHLTRNAPLRDFPEHERELLEGLFFDGGDHTDTKSIREHYEKTGFDPAGKIRKPLMERLKSLPGESRMPRRWGLPALVTLGGLGTALALDIRAGGGKIAIIALLVTVVATLIALPLAWDLSRRLTNRGGVGFGILLPIAGLAALLAMLALGAFEGEGGLVFYRPGAGFLLALVMALGGLTGLVLALARTSESAERLGFRRRLVSARDYFEAELEKPEPRLQDTWFPYLLAFGLGKQVDRWFESFGGRQADRGSGMLPPVVTGRTHGGSGGGGWSGGGSQFGGGSFAGGGAGGSWGVAVGAVAAGVSAPSSGGGGGGVSVSGGGSGGGW